MLGHSHSVCQVLECQYSRVEGGLMSPGLDSGGQEGPLS